MEEITKYEELEAIHESKPTYSLSDKLFSIYAVIMGFLLVNLVFETFFTGIGTTIFTLLFVIGTLLYFRKNMIKQNKRSLCYLGLTLLMGTYFALFDNPDIGFLAFLMLLFFACYWVYTSCELTFTDSLGEFLPVELLNIFTVLPFSNFYRLFASMFARIRVKNTGGKSVMLGLLCGIPAAMIAFGLLISSDNAFRDLWADLDLDFSLILFSGDWQYRAIIGIPAACMLFGLIFSSVRCQETALNYYSVDNMLFNMKRAPRSFIISGISPMLFIYLTYIGSQFRYLTTSFVGKIPEALTYAENARHGFFELIVVVLLNIVVIVCVSILSVEDVRDGITKIFLSIFAGSTIFMICTALSKMSLYISVYGLTKLRFYTTFFMSMLLIVFAIIFVGLFVKKLQTAKWSLRTCILFAIVFFFSNPNAIIAEHNITRYMMGHTRIEDTSAFVGLDSGGLIKFRDYFEKINIQKNVSDKLDQCISQKLEYLDWQEWTLQHAFLKQNSVF